MWKVTIRGVWGKKLRFLLTGVAVILGVAFMVGTLVFTDTTRRTFDDLFANVTAGTDAYVRGKKAFSSDFGDQRNRIPDSLVAKVRATDGVKAAEGDIQTYAQLVTRDGKALSTGGAPALGVSYPTIPELNSFRIQGNGRAPELDDEIVVDVASARRAEFNVGDTVTVLTQQAPRSYRISGIAKFGTADSPGGASLVAFTLAEAQRVAAAPDQLDGIAVVGSDGVTQRELVSRLSQVLTGAEVEILTGEELTKETQDQIGEQLSFFNTFLFVFAGVALFVGIFLIYNTFTIVVAQRLRELALLRAIGAKPGQVILSVVLESLVVGVLASLLGVVAGIGISQVLKVGLAAGGVDIPTTGIVLLPRTVILGLVVGTVITVFSAVVPAFRAGFIPPIAALRNSGEASSSGRRRVSVSLVRLVVGSVILGLGAGLLFFGLFASPDNAIAYVGAGAVFTFIGVFILAPTFARPLSRLLGARPVGVLVAILGVVLGAGAVGLLVGGVLNIAALGLASIALLGLAVILGSGAWTMFRAGRAPFGVAGVLARENAMRSPRRTAATASALMIGVGLVAFIAIFAQSIKGSIGAIVDDTFRSDFVVASQGFGSGFSPKLASEIAALPEVQVAAPLRFGPARINDRTAFLLAGNPAATSQVFDLGGGPAFDRLSSNGLAVSKARLESNRWSLGSPVEIQFAKTGVQPFVVESVFNDEAFGPRGDYFISLDAYDANFPAGLDSQIAVIIAPGVSDASARSALESALAPYPSAELQDRTEFKRTREQTIDQVVNLIYGLLALAIFIAILGIANTLGLSIYERTREIGLLRAVGMTRTQLRDMVRWESVIIALLGAFLGLGIGVFFGWAVVEALRGDGISVLSVPYLTLGVVVVLAVLAGIAAAVGPARRATKMNVLDAIASE
jgi:putative ABC transport system permease protein